MFSKASKGISEILVAVMLVVIAVSIAFSFFVFSQKQVSTVGDQTEKILDQSSRNQDANIVIDNAYLDHALVKNFGKVSIPSASFGVFLNSSKQNSSVVNVKAINVSGDLRPGQIADITLCAQSPKAGKYYLKVTAAYQSFDEGEFSMDIPAC